MWADQEARNRRAAAQQTAQRMKLARQARFAQEEEPTRIGAKGFNSSGYLQSPSSNIGPLNSTWHSGSSTFYRGLDGVTREAMRDPLDLDE